MISLPSYLFISFLLFVAGMFVMIARKNIVAILLGIELILNSAALNFVAYTKFVNNNLDGHIMSLFIIVIAAAEAAVGLAIVIRFYQLRESVHIDDATQLQS
ncbi:MAG: NADH-quinone oxidoreductase subunit NuoK [Bdellovibrio sp. CG12_big_fil_rev_8_21_14_0_65_39_13]|nr:MAG: NADH-quinone oxidoreductase subunit NuoK [Bdellovibrio sp. CG22_combo_CG10-13_8_21_14_all_39_27]PIQ60772.1 MAG: NADH-quinone oxidoreductase subunit NuoK [Bdellovibrio sp. CG12_big_fil_rev_8_21_14_0_65_39_13]PIR36395.1 MAG: NADH-quinone oxidoreductase subunit NuoK [Bdellovibrio sp. CG11_big_fil_rev_8_21_14_0_20_39_38]PJB54568.1 MAG: NADH-quinone oxidoreductase subunit NuoK [Bdellovibrio sp. CG_4_9_14_3_um_filter_39_7]